MRLFVGVPLPEGLKEGIVAIQQRLIGSGADLKLVEKENLHFTVKFLGEVNDNHVVELASRIAAIASHHSSFPVTLHSVGVFPTETFVRVVWVGVEENPAFVSLIKEVQEGLNDVRKEDHASIEVHLTIARVRSTKNLKKLIDIIKKLKTVSLGGFVADKFVLYRSDLSRNGPAYSVVKEFSFARSKPSKS